MVQEFVNKSSSSDNIKSISLNNKGGTAAQLINSNEKELIFLSSGKSDISTAQKSHIKQVSPCQLK